MLIITGVVRLGQGKLLWCQDSKDEKVIFFIYNNYYIWSEGILIHSHLKLHFCFISLPLSKWQCLIESLKVCVFYISDQFIKSLS